MISVIIVGAGSGKRMGINQNKIFINLFGDPVLFHSINAFHKRDDIDEIILVLKKEEIPYYHDNFSKYSFNKITKIISGGKERMNSVYQGLREVSDESKYVLIHDAARPLVSDEVIDDVIKKVKITGAVTPGIMPKDTIKVINSKGILKENLQRDQLRIVQTPQGFNTKELKAYYEEEINKGIVFTDDTYLFFNKNKDVAISHGDYKNIKITTMEDIEIAMALMQK